MCFKWEIKLEMISLGVAVGLKFKSGYYVLNYTIVKDLKWWVSSI